MAVETTESKSGSRLAAVHRRIAGYYTRTLETHGPTPLGVDWTCEPTQQLRFVQLLKLCDFGKSFTLNDIGCGYGALLQFLATRHRRVTVDYLGVDLSASMIAAANSLWADHPSAEFLVSSKCPRQSDYSIASGIFNVKQNESFSDWSHFVSTTLDDMWANSSEGLAVNFLAPPSHHVDVVPQLYRVEPKVWVSYCSESLGADVQLIAGYGMPEFTVIARRRRF